MNGHTFRQRFADYLVYLGLAAAYCVGVLLYLEYGRDYLSVDIKWLALGINTVIVFGYVICSCPRRDRAAPFWYAIAGLLLIHTVGFILILRLVSTWKLLWFVFLYPVEFALIERALLVTLGRRMEPRLRVAKLRRSPEE